MMQPKGIAARWREVILVGILPFLMVVPATATTDDRPGDLARRGFFGVRLRPVPADDRAKPQPEGGTGALVESVFPDSTASSADLRRGDLLIALDGQRINDPSQVIAMIAGHRAGDVLTIDLVRDGERSTKTATLKPRPLETSDAYRVEYGSVISRGKRLRTIVTRPNDDAKHPALFLIQGVGSQSIENVPGGTGAYARIIHDFTRRGFVTLRVDKPGQGDSEGGPTRDMDFETELDGYRQGLRAFKGLRSVDPDNVIIFGHSMGGVMGPLLGAEIPVKGIAVFGTIAKTWQEYMLENVRRQMALRGAGFAEIDRTLRQDAAIEQCLIAGLSPSEIVARDPGLKERIEDRYTEGNYYFGTHYVYFRQLAGKNLAEAWEKFGGHALAAWGKSDYISGEEDHELIARIVNRAHPGRGVFLALDGIDHAFGRASSPEESFRVFRKPDRELNPAFFDALRDWSTKVCDAGPVHQPGG
jgi:pimeloyl-ACP methyl ester carboxylesterase